MTVLELEIKKAELARNILNQNSEDIINRLSKLYKNLTNSIPCQYSEDEIITAIEEGIKEYESGGGIPHTEMKKKTTND